MDKDCEIETIKIELGEVKRDLESISEKLDAIALLFANTQAVLTAVKWIGTVVGVVWAVTITVREHLSITLK